MGKRSDWSAREKTAQAEPSDHTREARQSLDRTAAHLMLTNKQAARNSHLSHEQGKMARAAARRAACYSYIQFRPRQTHGMRAAKAGETYAQSA